MKETLNEKKIDNRSVKEMSDDELMAIIDKDRPNGPRSTEEITNEELLEIINKEESQDDEQED